MVGKIRHRVIHKRESCALAKALFDNSLHALIFLFVDLASSLNVRDYIVCNKHSGNTVIVSANAECIELSCVSCT